MKSLIKSLWPAEAEPVKWRPLRAGEMPATPVRVEHDPTDGREYRLVGWQECSKQWYALLDCSDGVLYVAAVERVRVAQ